VRRGPHSVGSHVRDAAAYVCWAFVRAYSSTIMNPYFEVLAPALLTTACYDREVFLYLLTIFDMKGSNGSMCSTSLPTEFIGTRICETMRLVDAVKLQCQRILLCSVMVAVALDLNS
jgi:hypothetical protein